MSRIVSVCLCAIVALATLTGSFFVRPASVLAASGTLSVATPLHESPGHGAPVIALVAEGTVVSIDGPPVDGFYPVTAGTVSGWMRGETLLLEKDVSNEGVATEPPVAEPDGMAPIEQTADDDPGLTETPVVTDPATDPALTAEAPVEGSGAASEWTEPAGEVTYDDPNAKAADPAADPSATTDGSPPLAEPAPVDEAAPVAAPVPADDVAAVNELAPTAEPAAEDAVAPPPAADSGAAPVPIDAGGQSPPLESAPAASAPEAAAEPPPDPNAAPIPAAETSPVGPASVTVDAPIRAGPGPSFDLIFTVPMGSTLQQTGNVIDGYVTAQYKEVTGWVALEHLGPPSSFVEETPLAETAAPAETPPVETAPAETPPAETPPPDTAPVAAPVEVKTPRPGSGVAYTTVDMSLRNGPSATEAPITVVPAGSRVVLTGVMEGGFQRVTYKDQIGWIAGEYLQSPADPEPEVGKRGNPQYSRREIIRIINQAADRYGQSRSDMVRVAECESNLDPYAVNPSGSYGLFQFIRSTWKSTPYGNKDIFDPEANANAAAWMWSEGRKSEWVCQ